MAELRLCGLDFNQITPLEKSFLLEHVDRQNRIQFYTTLLTVTAIQEAAIVMRQGGDFKNSRNLFKEYKGLLFPELGASEIDAAERTKKLLEREFKRGPMKFKTMGYGKRKKKKRGS